MGSAEKKGRCPTCYVPIWRRSGHCRRCARIIRCGGTPPLRRSPEWRANISAVQKRVWASRPKEARRCHRPDVWTARELDVLRELAGAATAREIAQALNDGPSLWPRTVSAVVQKLHQLGLSSLTPGYTGDDLERLFRCGWKTPRRWIADGHLRATRIGGEGKYRQWLVRREDLLAFLRDHRHRYDWRRITDRRLRAEAEVFDRADPYLTATRASQDFGIARWRIDHALDNGRLPCVRRHLRQRVFLRSNLLRWLREREERAA